MTSHFVPRVNKASLPSLDTDANEGNLNMVAQFVDFASPLDDPKFQRNAISLSPSSPYYGSVSSDTVFSPNMNSANIYNSHYPQNLTGVNFPPFPADPSTGVNIPNHDHDHQYSSTYTHSLNTARYPPIPPVSITTNDSGTQLSSIHNPSNQISTFTQDATINQLVVICPLGEVANLQERHDRLAFDPGLQQLHLQVMWAWFTKQARPRSEELLQFHRISRETGSLGYTCLWPGCMKDLSSRSDRAREHTLIHLGIKSFVCQFCDTRYLTANDLRRHEKGCRKNNEGPLWMIQSSFLSINGYPPNQIEDTEMADALDSPTEQLMQEDTMQNQSSDISTLPARSQAPSPEPEEFLDVPDLTNHVSIPKTVPVFVGPYSHIYKGHCHGRIVAVKVIRSLSVSMHSMRRKVDRERKIWSTLNHPNIMPLHGYTEESDLFGPFGALISLWYDNGDAGVFLESIGHKMTMMQRTELWKGVVSGLSYLHSCNPVIVHGDLKPKNILIDDHGVPMLCDFGLVRVILEEGNSGMTTTSDHTGTERYLAHELVWTEGAKPTTASDVHALGCTGLEFLFLQLSYANRKNNFNGLLFRNIHDGVPPAIRGANLNEQESFLWDILEACWKRDPEQRITVEEILANLSSA